MPKQSMGLYVKPTRKLFGFLLLAATALVIALPASAYAADITVNDEVELETAVAGAPATPYVIELGSDIGLASTGTPLDIPAGTDITLTGGHSLIGADGQDTITVEGTLTLDGITVTHNSGEYGGGIYILPGGTLTLSSGAISANTTLLGGGVFNYGTFTMQAGEISGNTALGGGGVYNSNNGTFTMQDGTISGNTAEDGGGVYNNGIFLMESGTISENTASGSDISYGFGGGVHNGGTFTMEAGAISNNMAIDGGGVYNSDSGTFTMQAGEISRNASDLWGGGVSNGAGTFTMEAGAISNNMAIDGGGVYNSNGDFTMEGGTVSDNAASRSGGGVFNRGTFTMQAGEISGNTADSNGGGVYNSNGAFTMEAGAISNNTATEGGGVYNVGTFTMEAGAISNNMATDGGGVYNMRYNMNDTVIIDGGTVSGNTATGYGGGIFTYDYARLTVAAGAVFSNNKAQAAYDRDPADDALYAAQIHGTVWTAPFTQGYNNYDINYTKGSLVAVVTVTFDGNGGAVLLGDESREVVAGGSLGADMPPDPTRDDEGLIFKGWNTAPGGSGTAFTSSTAVDADVTVYAQWDLATAPVTVAFDGNGGTVLPANETRTLNAGEPLGANMPPDPTWEGHLFTGWNMEPDGSGTAFTSETVLDADTVVYAQWEALVIAPAPVTVTFDGNGGVVLAGDKARTLDAGGSLGANMPPDPTRTRYDFIGWNTAPDGSGTAFTSSTVVDADVTVYAQWAAQGEPAIPPTGDDAFQLYGLSALCLILASTGLIGITRRKKASGK